MSDYYKITVYGIEKSKREQYPAYYEYKKQLWERGRFEREHKKRNTGKPRISFTSEAIKPKPTSGVTITWRAE